MAVCVSGDRRNGPGVVPDGDGPAAGRAAVAGSGGMANSVTRHAYFTGPEDWTFLACAVDSLDVSVHVDWGSAWQLLFSALEEGKTAAAGTKGILWDGGAWVIRPGGKPPMFRFHLQRAELNLFIGKRQTGLAVANVYASLSADLLWHEGIDGAVALLRASIEEFGGRVLEVKPSRVDLCADFLIPGGLALEFLRGHRVPENSRIRLEEEGPNLQTVYIGGRKSPIQLRIYDKSTELAVKGNKDWLWPIWGIEPSEDVWRVEFQLRREFLRQCGFHSVQALVAGLGGLWEYLTEKWVSFRLRDDTNTTRRTLHPWWQAVAEQKDGFGVVRSIERTKGGCVCSPHWYVSHVAGCLAGFAARIGVDDIAKASMELWKGVKDHWDQRDFGHEYAVRSIQLGRDPGSGGARHE